VLLLETGPEFAKIFAHSPAFALISTVSAAGCLPGALVASCVAQSGSHRSRLTARRCSQLPLRRMSVKNRPGPALPTATAAVQLLAT
jgi:hypothetical protein